MPKTLITAAIVLTVIISSITFLSKSAGAIPSPYTLDVDPLIITFSTVLRMHQNITALKPDFSLPTIHVLAQGSNATEARQFVEAAITTKTPGARIEDLRIQADSSFWSNSTNKQWFNLTLTFTVQGVSTRNGEIARADLSWKSFSITPDVLLGGIELNNIGKRYLADPAAVMASQRGGSLIQITYQANGRPTSASTFQLFVSRVSTLNFTRLQLPLSKWKSPYVPLTDRSVHSFDVTPSLGMSMTRQVQEPGAPEITTYGLFYDLQVDVKVPAGSRIEGDMVIIVAADAAENIMGIVVLAGVAIGSGTYLYEKRLIKPARAGKHKRPKR